MRIMKRYAAFAVLSAVLALGMGCPAFNDATGYSPATPAKPAITNPDGSVTPAVPAKPATVDVANSPVGKTLNTVDTIGGLTPFGPIVHLGVTGILGLLSVIGFVRGAQWKNAAVATAQGVQTFTSNLDAVHAQSAPVVPSVAADLLKKAIDTAHDDHGVAQGLQNTLTPTT